MKFFIPALFFIVLHPVIAFSQDTIIKTNADEIYGKILEISVTEVKYKLTILPDGPTYALPKKEVFMIKFKGGLKEKFYTKPESTPSIVYVANPNDIPNIKNIESQPKPKITPGYIDELKDDYYRGSILLQRSQLNQLFLQSNIQEAINMAKQSEKENSISQGFGAACGPLMASGFIIGGLSNGILFLYDGLSRGRPNYMDDPGYQMFSTTRIIGFSMAGVGVGCLAVSIGFKVSAKKNLSNAVITYNEQFPK